MSAAFDWSSFVEVPGFFPQWQACGCDDADLRRLQLGLLEDPTGWPVVPAAGGWRKARFAPPSWRTGKSGGVRVYYADLTAYGQILLGGPFTKTMASDLSARDKQMLAALLAAYRRRLEERH
jgi:hypothetical protein